MKPKILLGLSGGVDSAVSLTLLKQHFSQVDCAFMVNWDRAVNGDLPVELQQGCDSAADYRDASQVAQQCHSALVKLNYVKAYWDLVFQPFLNSYRHGRTPNPDVFCNKHIKFALLIAYSQSHGYNTIAMGHYAQVFYNLTSQKYELHRAKDRKKDQTYFLAFLNQAQLAKTIFPIGHLTKNTVRQMAEQHHLALAQKKDSTGICFIGERNFTEFLNHYLPGKTGPIIDATTQQMIGTHQNIYLYTLGQNKALHLAGQTEKYYVVGKNVTTHRLYVAPKNALHLIDSNEATLEQVHWISGTVPTLSNLTVQFRHRHHPVKVTDLKVTKQGHVHIKYQLSRAVTPGQIAVLYHEQQCLGGGVIAATFYNQQPLENWA